jgi:hypothetical protein
MTVHEMLLVARLLPGRRSAFSRADRARHYRFAATRASALPYRCCAVNCGYAAVNFFVFDGIVVPSGATA